MSKKSEPSINDLINWLEDKLSSGEADAVAQAVAEGPRLQATVEWLREFLHLSAVTRLEAPDAATHRAATEYFKAYAQGARRPGVLQTLRGLLESDSRQRLSPAGARNMTLQAAPRQLIYSTPTADIALNIQASDEQLNLIGQVFSLSEEEPVYTVRMIRAEQPLDTTMTDSVGKFSFFALQEGSYMLVLTADNHEIIIDPLELVLRAGS